MSRFLLVALPALLLVHAAPVIRSPSWTGWFGFQATHDDNPFRYSADDLGSFRRREDAQRFPIRSADDLDLTASTGWRYRYRLAGRPGSVALKLKLHQFASNREKSYQLASLGVSQSFRTGSKLTGSYLRMPDYLIRYYRDPENEQRNYVGCRFTEGLATARLEQKLGSFRVSARYRHQQDDYAAPFDYYDTRAHRLGGVLGWKPVREFGLDCDYEFKTAVARGPVPDISFQQHSLDVSISSSPRRLTNVSFEAGYGLARRQYTTDNPGETDPSHAARVDLIEEIDFEVGYRFGAARLIAGYRLEWREVSSPYSEQIEDVKRYRRNRFTVGTVVSLARLLKGDSW